MASREQPLRVGLLVGREQRFPNALIDAVNNRKTDVTCEMVRLDGTRMDVATPYAVLVDRISHEIPYYATVLKKAALDGTVVINNPFWRAADDKFLGAALITRLGLASPRTVTLPNQEYVDGVIDESLRNLAYPLDWSGILDYIGLPAVLKPLWGGGWVDVTVVHSQDELIDTYNHSGTKGMILQEFIEWEHYVRCICVGQERILPIRYNPRAYFHERYIVDHEHLSDELGARILHDARLINRAMGYDMNTVEFAIRDDVPYAIDFMNTAPDFDPVSFPMEYFQWTVNAMADLLITRARQQATATPPTADWQGMFSVLDPAWRKGA